MPSTLPDGRIRFGASRIVLKSALAAVWIIGACGILASAFAGSMAAAAIVFALVGIHHAVVVGALAIFDLVDAQHEGNQLLRQQLTIAKNRGQAASQQRQLDAEEMLKRELGDA